MSESEFVTTILESFTAATGRLSTSPLDYDQACTWHRQGMPLSVAWKGCQAKLSRCEDKKYRTIMPLSWCESDVQETFTNWQRAVGPRWRDVS